MSATEDRKALIQAWQFAQRELQIRVTAPFNFSVAETTHDCIAFLPDFGGPAGMVIDAISPSTFRPPPAVLAAAEKAGYYWSLINVATYRRFEAETFKEALRDWGYTGPAPLQPEWLQKTEN